MRRPDPNPTRGPSSGPGRIAPGALPTTRLVMLVGAAAAIATLGAGLVQQRWLPIAAKHGARANPWRGLPGCLYLQSRDGRRLQWVQAAQDGPACSAQGVTPPGAASATNTTATAAAGSPPVAAAPSWAVPPDAQGLLLALQPWLAAPPQARPGVAALAAASTPALTPPPSPKPRTAMLAGQPVLQGAAITLTVVAPAQSNAQQVLRCMTGHADACVSAGMPAQRWAHLHEGAATRMAALAQIDIATGAIEVLASAHSDCFARDAVLQGSQGQQGPQGPAPDCPLLAHAPSTPQPWRLDNHAAYSAANLGSLVKPLLALALLRSDIGPWLQGAGHARMMQAFKTSDTPAFLDWLYCRDSQFAAACARPAQLMQAAADLGLAGQPLPALLGQGQHLVLPGARALRQPATADSGREPASPGSGRQVWQPMTLAPTSPALRAACSARDWSQCDGEALANQTAELWGAGNTQGTPLGVAAVFSRLGAAANGSALAQPPHLAVRIQTGDGDLLPAPGQPLPVAAAHAQAILAGMSLTHTSGGTAHSACLAVLGTAAACNAWAGLAGKTGTPGFRHDRLAWGERNALCASQRAVAQAARAAGQPPPASVRADLARCAIAPVKWYAALVKDRAGGPWSKVVVVLTERNWVRATGKVDSALDRGTPNVAAEAAMRYLQAEGRAAQRQP